MTIYSNSQGKRKPIRAKLTTTNATTIFTGGSYLSYLDAINFCNITGSAATIDLWVNDGTSSYYIVKGQSIAAAGRFQITDLAADIGPGDTLRAQSDTGNAIDIVGVLIEQSAQQVG